MLFSIPGDRVGLFGQRGWQGRPADPTHRDWQSWPLVFTVFGSRYGLRDPTCTHSQENSKGLMVARKCLLLEAHDRLFNQEP